MGTAESSSEHPLGTAIVAFAKNVFNKNIRKNHFVYFSFLKMSIGQLFIIFELLLVLEFLVKYLI